MAAAVKPTTKHERNVHKALARSKRNSPRPEKKRLTHGQANKKFRRSASKMADAMQSAGLVASETSEKFNDFGRAYAETLTIAQLRMLCSQKMIKTTTKMRKSDLIEMLVGR